MPPCPTTLQICRIGNQTKDADRLRDVLDAPLTEILEAVSEPAPDVVVDTARDANPARLGKAFDPSSDVDTIAENIAVL